MTATFLTAAFGTLTVVGVLQILAGWVATARFARSAGPVPDGTAPMTFLKPLHGDEPLLAKALASLCEQDYPPGFQIVFGVRDATDPAVPLVQASRARYSGLDITLVIDSTRHGSNPKIGNLLNMLPAARHDILVIADSDVHARPDYARRLAAALARPGVGLVTTLYAGRPAFGTVACRLGATQITHGFLPGALLARALGRRDCLGATMCLTRETLTRAGGLAALRDHLADDNVLGARVRALGLDVALAGTVVETTVPERGFGALWRHELRWARTIRALAPAGFAASILQHPFFWAVLTALAAGGAAWSWGLLAAVWIVRGRAVTGIDRSLRTLRGGLAFGGPGWLLPLRDLLSAIEWIAGHAGRRVDWRGQALEADTPPRLNEGSHPR